MPSDVHRIRYRLPKFSYSSYRILMKSMETALGFGTNERAQFRFHCIMFLEKHGWTSVHDAFPHVSRATVYRWRKQYNDSRRTLNTLVPKSTRPHTTRQMQIPSPVLSFLKSMRKQHPYLSKYKLKPFLDQWCVAHGYPLYSVSWIGKVLRRHTLYFSTRKKVYKRRKQSRSGYTIRRTPNPNTVSLGYLQLDGLIVYWVGRKVTFLTAIELKTRLAWVRIVPTLSSTHATTFLKEILSDISFPLHTIHTDNGSEFHAVFDKAVASLSLTHLWSPPRSPKIHSHIERFNGVIQQEFIDYNIDTAVIDPETFQSQLTDWLTWYNRKRPHHSLNLMTPLQYLIQLQKEDSCLKCP